MANYPPPYPPPGFDSRAQRRFLRDQERAQRDASRAQREQLRYQMRSLRRSSVLGPILLIAVGVLFLLLQTGALPRHVAWDLYGRWWPLLLVAAGGILLAEWGFDQVHLRNSDQPAYRRTVGGGGVFLLTLFAMAGFAAESARLHIDGNKWFYGWNFNPDNLDELLGDKHESDQTADFPLAAGDSLAITNPRGSVIVNGTSTDGRIHVNVHKEVYSRSDSEAYAKAQQFTPQFDHQMGSPISIRMPSVDGVRADLLITVPASTVSSVTANHGDIQVTSISGTVNATANHGNIDLSSITGQATAHINSGGASISAHRITGGLTVEGHAEDVTLSEISGPVSIAGEFFGTTRLERIAGAVHFHTSRTDLQVSRLDGEIEISPHSELTVNQVVGPLVLTTHDRNISLDRIAGDVSITNRNGTVDLVAAAPLGVITVEDRNGSVTTTMPELAGFTVSANTSNGDVSADFPLSSSGGQNHKSMNGVVGPGGPLVHITTTNGDVAIHKAAVIPMPPSPPEPPRITLTQPSQPPASSRTTLPHK